MEQSITYNVSKTLTLDVVDPTDKSPNRQTAKKLCWWTSEACFCHLKEINVFEAGKAQIKVGSFCKVHNKKSTGKIM